MIELTELGRLFTSPVKQQQSTQSQQQQQQEEDNSSKNAPAVYLIGQECNMTFLVARCDIYINRTCIEMLRVTTNPNTSNTSLTRRILYVHDDHLRIVHASLNYEGTILAYTTFEQDTNDYRSFLVEVEHVNGHRYLFNINGNRFQTIKFLHDSANRKNNSFLFIRDNEKIGMFSVLTEKRKRITRIIAQPELQATYVTHHLWTQWDPDSSLLYYLVKKNEQQHQQQQQQHQHQQQQQKASVVTTNLTDEGFQLVECCLRCISFADSKKPSMLFEYSFPVKILSSVLSTTAADTSSVSTKSDNAAALTPRSRLSNVFVSEEQTNKCTRFPWRNGHSFPDKKLHFQIVRVNNGICLCQQHIGRIQEDFEISITIYVLHHRTRIDYTVPNEHLRGIQRENEEEPKVFFGQCNSMLLVYIPGVHLQLLDVCPDHAPFPSLTFYGSVHAPHLPLINGNSSRTRNAMLIGMSCNAFPSVMINLRNGVIYSYKLSKISLERWFTSSSTTTLSSFEIVSLVHILVNHLCDVEFLEGVMRTIIQQEQTANSRKILSKAISEYLTGTSYELFRLQCADKDFAQLLPMSFMEKHKASKLLSFELSYMSSFTVTHYHSSAASSKQQQLHKHTAASNQTNSPVVNNPTNRQCTFPLIKSIIQNKLSQQQYNAAASIPITVNSASSSPTNTSSPKKTSSSPSNHSNRSPMSHSPGIYESSPLKSFKLSLINLFSSSSNNSPVNSNNTSNTNTVEADSYSLLTRKLFTDALIDAIVGSQVKLKQKYVKFIHDYVTIVVKQVNMFYTTFIKSNDSEAPSMNYFRVLSCFYSALEETCFPYPNQFQFHFSVVAYSILPKNLFLQHVNRDIVRVSQEMLDYVFRDLLFNEYSEVDQVMTEENRQFLFNITQRCMMSDESRVTFYEKIFMESSPMLIHHYHSILYPNYSISSPDLLLEAYNQQQKQILSESSNSSSDGDQTTTKNVPFLPLLFYLLSLPQISSANLSNSSTNSISTASGSTNMSLLSFMNSSKASQEYNSDNSDDEDDSSDESMSLEEKCHKFIMNNSTTMLSRYAPL